MHTHVGLDIGARTAAGDRAVDPGRAGARDPGRGADGWPPAPCRRAAADQAVDPVCGMTVTVGAGHPARHRRRGRPLVLQPRLPGPVPGARPR